MQAFCVGEGIGAISCAAALPSDSLKRLPSTLTAKDWGALFDASYFHNSSMQTVDTLRTVTYFVSSSRAIALTSCSVHEVTASRISPPGKIEGFVPGARMICFRVDQPGNATLAKILLFQEDTGHTLGFEQNRPCAKSLALRAQPGPGAGRGTATVFSGRRPAIFAKLLPQSGLEHFAGRAERNGVDELDRIRNLPLGDLARKVRKQFLRL